MRSGPGDVGRRVIHRRAELGITREQLAERAGVPVEFIDYVETQPAELSVSSLRRLAAALEVAPGTLLGSGLERPPGGTGSRTGLVPRELSPAECWDLICPGGIGRVAAVAEDGLVILPVNFTVDERTVVVRTSAYGVLGRLDPATEVAFEVDRIDDAMREGWSVLLVGEMEHVEDPSEAAGLWKTKDPGPWVGGVRNLFLRLRPRRVTGRRIEAT